MAKRNIQYKIDLDITGPLAQLKRLQGEIRTAAAQMARASSMRGAGRGAAASAAAAGPLHRDPLTGARTAAGQRRVQQQAMEDARKDGAVAARNRQAARERTAAFRAHAASVKKAAVEEEMARGKARMHRMAYFAEMKRVVLAYQDEQRASRRLARAKERNALVIDRNTERTLNLPTAGLHTLGPMGRMREGLASGLMRGAGGLGGGIGKAMQALAVGFKGFSSAVSTFSGAISQMGRSVLNYRTLIAGYFGAQLAKSISGAASDFQASVIQLSKLGEAYQRQGRPIGTGPDLARMVYRQAIETPFEAKDIMEGMRRMMAFQIFGGMGQRQSGGSRGTDRIMAATQDLAATFGRSVSEISELMGRLSTGEAVGLSLRSLARFGVLRSDIQKVDPSIQFRGRGELAYDPRMVKQYGIAQTRAIMGMKLLAATVKAIEREFAGMSQSRMKEFRTRMQNLGDAWQKAVIPAGDILNKYLSPIVLRLTEHLEKMQPAFTKMAENMVKFSTTLTGLIPGLESERQKKFGKSAAGQIAELEQEMAMAREGVGTSKFAAGVGTGIMKIGKRAGVGLKYLWGALRGQGGKAAVEANVALQKIAEEGNYRAFSDEQLQDLMKNRFYLTKGHRERSRAGIQAEMDRRDELELANTRKIKQLREKEREQDTRAVKEFEYMRGTDPVTENRVIQRVEQRLMQQRRVAGPQYWINSQENRQRQFIEARKDVRNARKKEGTPIHARGASVAYIDNRYYGTREPSYGHRNVQGAWPKAR